MDDDVDAGALEWRMRLIAQRADPVPDAAVHAAMESLTWLTVDAELAELVHDSVVDADPRVLVRGADAARSLTFQTDTFAVEVAAISVGPERELRGLLVPAGPSSVTIRHRDGAIEVAVNEFGQFGPIAVPAGPISLQFQASRDAEVVIATEWLPV